MLTSGQSNLTKDRITAAHGRFNHIHMTAYKVLMKNKLRGKKTISVVIIHA